MVTARANAPVSTGHDPHRMMTTQAHAGPFSRIDGSGHTCGARVVAEGPIRRLMRLREQIPQW